MKTRKNNQVIKSHIKLLKMIKKDNKAAVGPSILIAAFKSAVSMDLNQIARKYKLHLLSNYGMDIGLNGEILQ